MGSTSDEPEAIESSIHMADSNGTSPVSYSSPTESAPPKRSKHSGAGRKGSLMFTPGGSVGLGAPNVMNPNNILPNKLMDHTSPESSRLNYTVQSSTPINGIKSNHNGIGSTNRSNLVDKSRTDEVEVKPVAEAPSLRSSKGRKGSLMFTTSGTVGIGSNSMLHSTSADPGKELKINVSMQTALPQSEHPVGESSSQSEPQTTPVVHTISNGSVRKGSLMFTNNGTVGLGSTASSEGKESDPQIVNYANTGNGYTSEQPPVTYYTIPKSEPFLEEHPTTYFTQPNPTLYTNPNTIEAPYMPPTNGALYMPPTNEIPTPLSGDSFVALLLKAELEGNRQKAVELERRGSCVVTPGGMGGLGMRGFEDLSSDEEYKGARKPGSLPGSEDYRPLVGGFAAAAYEAAKAHHYKGKQRSSSNVEESEEDKNLPRLPPPCI